MGRKIFTPHDVIFSLGLEYKSIQKKLEALNLNTCSILNYTTLRYLFIIDNINHIQY